MAWACTPCRYLMVALEECRARTWILATSTPQRPRNWMPPTRREWPPNSSAPDADCVDNPSSVAAVTMVATMPFLDAGDPDDCGRRGKVGEARWCCARRSKWPATVQYGHSAGRNTAGALGADPHAHLCVLTSPRAVGSVLDADKRMDTDPSVWETVTSCWELFASSTSRVTHHAPMTRADLGHSGPSGW